LDADLLNLSAMRLEAARASLLASATLKENTNTKKSYWTVYGDFLKDVTFGARQC
jgi:hypothetical protein